MKAVLWTVRVTTPDGTLYGVRSMVSPEPMPNDRIRYGHQPLLVLRVNERECCVGTAQNPVVFCEALAWEGDLEETLRKLRFQEVT